MPNTGLIITANTTGVASTANTTQFWPFNSCLIVNNTEANVQELCREPGWFKSLTCILSANAVASTSTFRFRKNSANGNQVLSITASTSGTFQDLANQDHVATVDKYCFTTVPGAATNTYTLTFIEALFDSDQDFITRMASATSFAYTTGTDFNCVGGRIAAASSEAGIKARQRKAGTYLNGQCTISANAKTSTMTYQFRKNGANSNIAVSIGIGATGIVEDTTHTDSVAVGDDYNGAFVVGTDTTNACTFIVISVAFKTKTDGKFTQIQAAADADVVGTVSVTRFVSLSGNYVLSTTEAPCQCKVLGTFIFSEMTIQQTQSATNATTFTFRKNTANGNQTISVAGGATGAFSSATTLFDICFANDLICLSIAYGATTAGAQSKVIDWGYSYNPQVFTMNMNSPSFPFPISAQAPTFG